MFVVKGANRMTTDKRKEYIDQVRLIISILPILAEQSVFAFMGGTLKYYLQTCYINANR